MKAELSDDGIAAVVAECMVEDIRRIFDDRERGYFNAEDAVADVGRLQARLATLKDYTTEADFQAFVREHSRQLGLEDVGSSVTLELDEGTVNRLKRAADLAGFSLNATINLLLGLYIAEREGKPEAET